MKRCSPRYGRSNVGSVSCLTSPTLRRYRLPHDARVGRIAENDDFLRRLRPGDRLHAWAGEIARAEREQSFVLVIGLAEVRGLVQEDVEERRGLAVAEHQGPLLDRNREGA